MASSRRVSCLAACPTYSGESGPGGHGGMILWRVTKAIEGAYATASRDEVSGNGAMPPARWQPAHLSSRIGRTSREAVAYPLLSSGSRERGRHGEAGGRYATEAEPAHGNRVLRVGRGLTRPGGSCTFRAHGHHANRGPRLHQGRDDDGRGGAAAARTATSASSASGCRASPRTSPAARTRRGCVLIYESGTIGAKPTVPPLSIGDGELAETADAVVSVPEIFAYWLQGGRIDVGFLGAAQIDRRGNLNSTVIGDYEHPKVQAARRAAARPRSPATPRDLRDAPPVEQVVRRVARLRVEHRRPRVDRRHRPRRPRARPRDARADAHGAPSGRDRRGGGRGDGLAAPGRRARSARPTPPSGGGARRAARPHAEQPDGPADRRQAPEQRPARRSTPASRSSRARSRRRASTRSGSATTSSCRARWSRATRSPPTAARRGRPTRRTSTRSSRSRSPPR